MLKPLSLYIKAFLLFVCLYTGMQAGAQYKVQGTVYDSSRNYVLPAVTVLSTNGAATATDANGHYNIQVGEKDSIWFSYLGKPTVKFPILKMNDPSQFDIALQINVKVLPEVKVRPRNYREDSLQNRRDYAKIFNYEKPNLGTMTSIGPTGAGIDINEVIRLFQFRKNKATLRFQDRLLQQEEDKFVDHRFSKALVRRLTGLSGEELDAFMQQFRPAYAFAKYSSDYDFQLYIKEAFKMYQRRKKGF